MSADAAAAADHDRRDQRRHREPRGRAAAAQRPQLPGAGAAERRRRAFRRAARAARRCSRRARCPNVGGQRSGHNIYLLDGAKVTDELFNNLVINPSVDSIQEFKIQKSMYPAEFGGKASALDQRRHQGRRQRVPRQRCSSSIATTRSTRATTSTPRTQPMPPLRQNQFGGALGGPLVQRPQRSSSAATRGSGCAGR